MTEPTRQRTVEVIAEIGGTVMRGSGYAVCPGVVLTAAHVIADATHIQVRFNADRSDEQTISAYTAMCGSAADVAVLTYLPDNGHQTFVAAKFGRVGERSGVIACTTVGFPRFKLRNESRLPSERQATIRYRDSHHATGTIATLSNWREGSFEILVAPPEADPEPTRSPWEGMSGAAVWSEGRLIGLVSKHHSRDGLNRLAATRVDRWHETLSPGQVELLCRLAAFPRRQNELVDVLPADPGELVIADYIDYARTIAPEELLGRESELADLAAFCLDDEPYQWWQAPWHAGKSALLAWLVVHPPIGVTIFSFFVTARLQADSAAFSEALIEQLSATVGEPFVLGTTPAGRVRQCRRLLREAVARVSERGEQLLLIVDGLDEDRGAPHLGIASIASLLPDHPALGMSILVTSTPHYVIPDDVSPLHPMRTCKVRNLTPSLHAKHIELAAKKELNLRLRGADHLDRDIVGYLAAAGGLTVRELSELSGARFTSIDDSLGGAFGRILQARPARAVPGAGENEYLFAHQVLQDTAELQLGRDLDYFKQRIHEWAEGYRDQDWPVDTPRYLFRPYARFLVIHGELTRLTALATDPSRHNRMLANEKAEDAALAEISDAQQSLLTGGTPELSTLVSLAAERDRLLHGNSALPPSLPALWVRLGDVDSGLAKARSIGYPTHRAQALCKVAHSLISIGEGSLVVHVIHEAEHAARLITFAAWRADSLLEIGKLFGAIGLPVDARRLVSEAEQIIRIMDEDIQKSWGRALLTDTLIVTGRVDQARETARSIIDPDWAGKAQGDVATSLAKTGEHDQAISVAEDISDPWRRVVSLGDIALIFTQAGAIDRARRVIRDLETIVETIPDPWRKADGLMTLATVLAQTQTQSPRDEIIARAEETARSVADKRHLPEMLTRLAACMLSVGHELRSRLIAQEVEDSARKAPDSWPRVEPLMSLLAELASAGDFARAENVARTIPGLGDRAEALTQLSLAVSGTGERMRLAKDAESCVMRAMETNLDGIADYMRGEEQARLSAVLTVIGRTRKGEEVARGIPDLIWQQAALTSHSVRLAKSGGVDHAKQVADSLSSDWQRSLALAEITSELTAQGRIEQAREIAQDIPDPSWRAFALADLALFLAEGADMLLAKKLVALAERAAMKTEGHEAQSRAFEPLILAVLEIYGYGKAMQVAQLITDPSHAAFELAFLASRMSVSTHIGTEDTVLAADAAAHSARSVVDERGRAIALAWAAAWAAKSQTLSDRVDGLVREAEDVARDVVDPFMRAWTLARVVPKLLKGGLVERAEHIALSIDSAEEQASAIINVANYFNDRRTPADRLNATRLCSKVLVNSSWAKALPLAICLDSECLNAAYEALVVAYPVYRD
jgi:hypothetical protein